jgi:hypothetical protein
MNSIGNTRRFRHVQTDEKKNYGVPCVRAICRIQISPPTSAENTTWISIISLQNFRLSWTNFITVCRNVRMVKNVKISHGK